METTTIEKIKEITGGNIVPEFYYVWGHEHRGYVSAGLYLNDIYYSCDVIPRSDVVKYNLKYHCPFFNL